MNFWDKPRGIGRYAGTIIFFLLLVSLSMVTGQETPKNSFYIGTEVPIFYSAGASFTLFEPFSLDIRGGYLTRPYDKVILNIMKKLGTEEALTNTIGDAFSSGYSFQSGLIWNKHNFYVGCWYSFVALSASDAPANAISNYYNIPLPEIIRTLGTPLLLQSNLQNLGLITGYNLSFGSSPFKVRVELSFGKTFYSSSILKTESDGTLTLLTQAVDETLKEEYLRYGYLPSLNLYFVRTF